jgi:hypothetical protein
MKKQTSSKQTFPSAMNFKKICIMSIVSVSAQQNVDLTLRGSRRLQSQCPSIFDRFDIINSTTDQKVASLKDGDTIYLDTSGLSSPQEINIMAVPCGTSSIGSVKFNLDGNYHQRIENAADYLMCGNTGSDAYPCPKMTLGPHILTVSAHSLTNAGGSLLGSVASISFTVAQSSKAPTTAAPVAAPTTAAPVPTPKITPAPETAAPVAAPVVAPTTKAPVAAPTTAAPVPTPKITPAPVVVPVPTPPTTPTSCPIPKVTDDKPTVLSYLDEKYFDPCLPNFEFSGICQLIGGWVDYVKVRKHASSFIVWLLCYSQLIKFSLFQ